MKRAAATLIALLSLTAFAAPGSRVEKPALLSIPDVVSIQDRLFVSVEFRWDEEKPLSLDIWSFDGKLSTYGDIQCFDESGKEVPMVFPMSMPLIPSGKKEVQKGEILKIGLYYMGSVQFPRPGSYYAVAVFSSAFRGDVNVRFTTSKKWFRVVEGTPKKKDA